MIKKLLVAAVAALTTVAAVSTYAATIDLTVGGYVGLPGHKSGKTYVLTKTVDFSSDNAAASDTVQLLKIPKNTMVQQVFWSVDTVEGVDTSTANLGDDGSPARYADAIDLNTANTGEMSTNSLNLPYLYETSNTVDLVIDTNAIDTAVITIRAICIDVSR